MPKGMALTTVEGNRFKIQGFDQFIVIMEETYQVQKGFIQAHEDTNAGIGGISTQLRFFSNFDELSQHLTNVSKIFFIPVL